MAERTVTLTVVGQADCKVYVDFPEWGKDMVMTPTQTITLISMLVNALETAMKRQEQWTEMDKAEGQ